MAYHRSVKPLPPIARVYVAGHPSRKASANFVASHVRAHRYEIASLWHQHPGVTSVLCEIDDEDFQSVLNTNGKYLISTAAAMVWVGTLAEWMSSWERLVAIDVIDRGGSLEAKRFDDDVAMAGEWEDRLADLISWLGGLEL